MAGSKESSRKHRQQLKKQALLLVGKRCIFCGATRQLEMAHIASTNCRGAGRGMDRRWRDVINNPDNYRPMCHRHHVIFDGLLRLRDRLTEEPIPF